MARDYMCQYGDCHVEGPDLPVTVVYRNGVGDSERPRFCSLEHAAQWCLHLAERTKRPMVSPFAVGDDVEGGDVPDDYDTGKVMSVYQHAVSVAWDSGTRTTQDASLLRKKGTRPIPRPVEED